MTTACGMYSVNYTKRGYKIVVSLVQLLPAVGRSGKPIVTCPSSFAVHISSVQNEMVRQVGS